MSRLGEVRRALAAALDPLPERVQVSLLGGEYDDGVEKFGVRVLVGEPSPETEDRIDDLLADDGPVLTLLGADSSLGGTVANSAVRSHIGHRAFKQPDDTVLCGTEFVVEIYR